MRRILIYLFVQIIYFQIVEGQSNPDSTSQILYAWKLEENFTYLSRIPVDTLFYQFQIFNPNFKKFPFNAYLGNLGSPALASHFQEQLMTPNMPFLKPFHPYIHLPQNQQYFNTKKPFSTLHYTTGWGKRKAEQTLGILHTQNVNEYLNLGLCFNLVSSDGQYSNQKAGVKSLSLFSSYLRERYNLHASFNLNSINFQENGGITDDMELIDTKTEDVPVNLGTLNEAESEMKNRNVLLVQSYTLGKPKYIDTLNNKSARNRKFKMLGTWSHIFQYQKNQRFYYDEIPESGFYMNIFMDSTKTSDAIHYRLILNSIQFEFQSDPERRFRFGGKIGVSSELENYHTKIPTDTIIEYFPPDIYTQPEFTAIISNTITTYKRTKEEDFHNIPVSFQLANDLENIFNWKVWGKYFVSGYKNGDVILEGLLRKSFDGKKGPSELSIHGKLRNYRPGYWYNNYYSNHFLWENDFLNITETTVTGDYYHPDRRFRAGAYYSLLDQHVYYDSLAKPSQYSGIISVFGLSLEKDLKLGRWYFLNKLMFQQSDHHGILPLPALVVYQSTYFQHNFHFNRTNGDLLTQWGFDVFYHTPYYGYAYMPATGQFYLQTEKKLGNYPFLDVFINAKLKRTRLFIKYEHVTSGLFGAKYFTILHHPMNQRVFKFGLAWTFYD